MHATTSGDESAGWRTLAGRWHGWLRGSAPGLVGLAVIVGAGAGLGAVVFRSLIPGFTELFTRTADSVPRLPVSWTRPSPEGPVISRTAMFDPRSATASAHHREVYGRYQKIYTLVEFAAAVAFVVGSVLFFYPAQQIPATWFFLVGSILFAARPTVRVLREYHLARIPLPGDARPDHA